MRYLLRRIWWLIPTWVLATLLAYVSVPNGKAQPPEALHLPLLFNSSPEDVRSLAAKATERIARGGAPREMESLLVRLGGAALPYILPRLDELAPEARARVAMALAPVARRMRVASNEELVRPEQAVLFWSRFWEDRAIEFRPAVAKRLARRIADRASTTRREELLALDTYALPALMAELRGIREPADVARVARVSRVLCQITDQDWQMANQASAAQAQVVAEQWQAWWSAHRHEYLALDGPRRLAAMLLDTRYGHWAAQALWERFPRPGGTTSLFYDLPRGGRVTLWLFLVALIGGWAGGAFLGLISVSHPRSWGERGIAVVLLISGSLPVATLSTLLAPAATPVARAFLATWIVVMAVGATVAWYVRAGARQIRWEEHYLTLVGQGADPWRVALRSAPQVALLAVSLLAVDLPGVLGTVFAVEQAFGLPGLGTVAAHAIAERNLARLSAIAVLSTSLVWFAQTLGDVLLRRLDPRLAATVVGRPQEPNL